jgi:thiol-disulfide isomerase/thioredoxin
MKFLFFKAPWCAACHSIEPHVPDSFEHIDCDEQPDIAQKYGVVTLPLFVAIDDDGNELDRTQTSSIPALTFWKTAMEDNHG